MCLKHLKFVGHVYLSWKTTTVASKSQLRFIITVVTKIRCIEVVDIGITNNLLSPLNIYLNKACRQLSLFVSVIFKWFNSQYLVVPCFCPKVLSC